MHTLPSKLYVSHWDWSIGRTLKRGRERREPDGWRLVIWDELWILFPLPLLLTPTLWGLHCSPSCFFVIYFWWWMEIEIGPIYGQRLSAWRVSSSFIYLFIHFLLYLIRYAIWYGIRDINITLKTNITFTIFLR